MTAREDVPSPAPSLPRVAGLVVVDKPLGWTSHDVVSRMRRLAGTRKVGHAGTLDPAASGVLVLGVEKATKLLTYVTGADKTYETTIRLGAATVTDDAEGDIVRQAPPERLEALTEEQIRAAVGELTGEIQQVPSSVSAIKVNGERSYARVRKGEDVELAARPVTVREFTVHTVTRPEDTAAVDVTATVTCTSGTYIRALARDVGEALGVGGHLTALRRTRSGPFDQSTALPVEDAAAALLAVDGPGFVPLTAAATAVFPERRVSAEEAVDLGHGKRVPASGAPGLHAAVAPDGRLVALVEDSGSTARVSVGFPA